MKEQFEDRKLTGTINVACKFDDGTIRYWIDDKQDVINTIVSIVDKYSAMNYRLTLRQLHYQFVGHHRGYVNHQSAYSKLGDILDDCRYGGVIDWEAIVDRGRKPYLEYAVRDVKHALEDTHEQYKVDRQQGQDVHVEVWTEKDALSEILQTSTDKYHVRLCVNKGYTSSSAIYQAYRRFKQSALQGKVIEILYIGDHDPSGIDMIRDVKDRLGTMLGVYRSMLEVLPICLTMAQIRMYNLPPNPTKITDSRAKSYIKTFGKTCWEVDALDPGVLTETVEVAIEQLIDFKLYKGQLYREKRGKAQLKKFIKTL